LAGGTGEAFFSSFTLAIHFLVFNKMLLEFNKSYEFPKQLGKHGNKERKKVFNEHHANIYEYMEQLLNDDQNSTYSLF
jgi:hypothetical protein